MKFAPALAALYLIGTPTFAHATDPQLAPQLARNLAATCANCHGTNGHSVGGMDSLAGESQDRLMRKLRGFKSGERAATIMHQIAKGYTDEQLALIAAYFAAQSAVQE